jgi:hypothetical protein
MSKSTKRYGKVLFKKGGSIDANPAPTGIAIRQLLDANTQAQKMYKRDYDKLSDRQKQEVHYVLRSKEEKTQQHDRLGSAVDQMIDLLWDRDRDRRAKEV